MLVLTITINIFKNNIEKTNTWHGNSMVDFLKNIIMKKVLVLLTIGFTLAYCHPSQQAGSSGSGTGSDASGTSGAGTSGAGTSGIRPPSGQ